MDAKLKRNYVLQISYQILSLVLPLITAPYVARIIGPKGTGTQSYYYNLANYFVYFSMLGLAKYGNRLVAVHRDNKEELDKTVNELFTVHVVLSIVTTVVYLVCGFFINSSDKVIYFISFIYVISSVFDLNWVVFGLEEIGQSVLRSLIVKVCSTISVFVFVNEEADLPKYVFILAVAQLLSYLLVWPCVLKRIKLRFNKIGPSFAKHIKSLLVFFVPLIAVSIYKSMDKLMIKWITSSEELGYYENADKIITLILAIITSLGTVLLPRFSSMVKNEENEAEIEQLTKLTQKVNYFVTFGCVFGIEAVADIFIPFYYGVEFEPSIVILRILGASIVFSAVNDLLRMQYIIPHERDYIYVISVIVGAGINAILNLILIPKWYASGAAVATLLAEIVVFSIQVLLVRKDNKRYVCIKNGLPFFASGVCMFFGVYFVRIMLLEKSTPLITLILSIIVGVILYVGLSYLIIKIKTKWR